MITVSPLRYKNTEGLIIFLLILFIDLISLPSDIRVIYQNDGLKMNQNFALLPNYATI